LATVDGRFVDPHKVDPFMTLRAILCQKIFELYAVVVGVLVCTSFWSIAAVADDDVTRAKTAPTAQQRRRQWQAGSIEVRTDVGSNIKIKAPG